MTAVQVPYDEFMAWLDPPPLHRDRFESLGDEAVADLLLARFRAFVDRGLAWQHALLLAVTPDA